MKALNTAESRTLISRLPYNIHLPTRHSIRGIEFLTCPHHHHPLTYFSICVIVSVHPIRSSNLGASLFYFYFLTSEPNDKLKLFSANDSPKRSFGNGCDRGFGSGFFSPIRRPSPTYFSTGKG